MVTDTFIILRSFIISQCSIPNTEIEGGFRIGERGGMWSTGQCCVLTAWQGGPFMCQITVELRLCCQVGVSVWMLIAFSFVSILLYIIDQKSSSWTLGNDIKTVQDISK